jgi:hypothetical protein
MHGQFGGPAIWPPCFAFSFVPHPPPPPARTCPPFLLAAGIPLSWALCAPFYRACILCIALITPCIFCALLGVCANSCHHPLVMSAPLLLRPKRGEKGGGGLFAAAAHVMPFLDLNGVKALYMWVHGGLPSMCPKHSKIFMHHLQQHHRACPSLIKDTRAARQPCKYLVRMGPRC